MRSAWRGLRAARAAESFLLAAAGLAATAAAASLSGAATWSRDGWIASAIGAITCGMGWWRTHLAGRLDVARILDEKLRMDGALVAAFDCERSSSSSPLAQLLSARVARRLRRREALRLVVPSPAPAIAAPFLAAACLFAALEERRDATSIAHVAALAEGLATEVADLRPLVREAVRTGAADPSALHGLPELASRSRMLALRVQEGSAEEEEVARELEALDSELARLQRSLPAASEPARKTAAARSWVDAARMGVPSAAEPTAEAAEEAREGARSETEGLAAASPDVRIGAPNTPGGPAVSPGDRGIAPAPGTEVAPAPGSASTGANADGASDLGDPGSGEPVATSASGRGSERGTLAGAWWPAGYDAIVARWVEARRRASSPDSTPH